MSLQEAPDHLVLAVDLIELLEDNQIPAQTVLAALAVVQRDFERKLQAESAGEEAREEASRIKP